MSLAKPNQKRSVQVPAPLRTLFEAVEMLILHEEPLSLLQVTFLRQALYCFPELHGPCVGILEHAGKATDIERFLDTAVFSTLDNASRLETLLCHPKFTVDNTQAAAEIISLIAGKPDAIPARDILYFYASIFFLREKFANYFNLSERAYQQNSAAAHLDSLKHYFFRPEFTKSTARRTAPLTITLDGIKIQRKGLTDISCIRSEYAETVNEDRILSALQHPDGRYFVYGPHKRLLSGTFLLELVFSCQKETEIDLEIYDSASMKVLRREFRILDEGFTKVEFFFEWSAETMTIFESRVKVLKPRFGKVALHSYSMVQCAP